MRFVIPDCKFFDRVTYDTLKMFLNPDLNPTVATSAKCKFSLGFSSVFPGFLVLKNPEPENSETPSANYHSTFSLFNIFQLFLRFVTNQRLKSQKAT